MNEVQVIGMLLACDQVTIPMYLWLMEHLRPMASDIPWNGPVGCVRVAH